MGLASAFRLRSASYGGRSRSLSYGGRAACAGRHRCEFPIQLSYSERMCVRILAARCARALRRLPPSIRTRGRRESRMRAAPAVSCANMHKKRTRAYRFSGGNPAFPAQWFTAYFELSPVNGFLATVAPEKLCFSGTLRQHRGVRTTRLRRPLESRSSVATFASTASHRAFVTIASRPSHRVRRAEL
jgi:hypothetical protein